MPVPSYDLMIDSGDLHRMKKNSYTHRFYEAFLRYENQVLPIRIGYRGQLSRSFPKPSYEIRLASGHLIEGQPRLHLNATYRDPSLLRGRLAFAIFQDLGVTVPQAWHAWLTLNGKPLGLYTAVESLDGDWLGRQGFESGTIYYSAGGEGNLGLISRKSGRQKQHLSAGFEKCFPADDDFSSLKDLIYQISLPDQEEFDSAIDTFFEMDDFLRWLTGVMFMCHTDGLAQNYALLKLPGQRWKMSPWDCDGTWGRTPYGHRISADDSIYRVDRNYLAVRLLNSCRWRRRYKEMLDALLPGPLSPSHIMERLYEIYDEIGAPAHKDDQKWRSNGAFADEPGLIESWLTARVKYVRRQL